MLKVGLPVGAVKNALQRDGQDPSIMDLDQNRYVVHLMFCAQVIFVNRTRPKVQHDTSSPLRFLTYFHPSLLSIAGPSKSSSTKEINTGNLRCRNGCEDSALFILLLIGDFCFSHRRSIDSPNIFTCNVYSVIGLLIQLDM